MYTEFFLFTDPAKSISIYSFLKENKIPKKGAWFIPIYMLEGEKTIFMLWAYVSVFLHSLLFGGTFNLCLSSIILSLTVYLSQTIAQ